MDIYIKQGEQTLGPFSLQEIASDLATGELDHEVEVRFEGSGGWVPVSQVPGLENSSPRSPDAEGGGAQHTSSQKEQAVTAEWDKGDDLYAVLPNAVKMSLDILFAPLEKGLSNPPKAVVYIRETIDVAAVRDAFMASAAKYTEAMPGVFATFLRDISDSVNVQATTTKTLEKEIRLYSP